jgi:hypothetical protein
LQRGSAARRQEADDVRWHELNVQGCSELVDAEGAQIFVEVASRGDNAIASIAGCFGTMRQACQRSVSCHIGVTDDIEPAQAGGSNLAARRFAESRKAIGKVGGAERRESTVSMPSPAASTSLATPNRTALPLVTMPRSFGQSCVAWSRAKYHLLMYSTITGEEAERNQVGFGCSRGYRARSQDSRYRNRLAGGSRQRFA